MFKYIYNKFLFLFIFFPINNASNILSGIKSLNNFLYLSRYKKYYKQNKTNSCSLIDGSDCYFTEMKYLYSYNDINDDKNIILEDWNKSFEISKKYGLDNTYLFYRNKTKEYLLKNSNEIDFEQNSQGEIFKYLLTFDSFNELTKLKDIYFEDKDKKIFYNEEIIINIKGKLRLSYDKDESEEFLREINADYPSKTYGIIESKFISISFQGKLFLCNFLYIKRHDEKNKKELIYFFGYIGNKAVFTQSYLDNKKRNEKWLKVHFSNIIPINNLVISGPYDIDNLSLTFLNKNYDDSDLYKSYKKQNFAKLIKDEDI